MDPAEPDPRGPGRGAVRPDHASAGRRGWSQPPSRGRSPGCRTLGHRPSRGIPDDSRAGRLGRPLDGRGLWAGPGAALVQSSAGYAWGLVRSEPAGLEVVVPAGRRVRDADSVAVTRSRWVAERVDPNAWPHRISATHTVLDLARGQSIDRAVTLAARAVDLQLASPGQIAAALSSRPRQSDRRLLLEILSDVGQGSESAAEVRYVRDVERRHGLPPGRRQASTDTGGRRDVDYEEFGLVVEIDGRVGHQAWASRQKDGRRDRTTLVGGRVTVRCFWVDLVPTACELAVDVGTIIRSRGWTGQVRPCGPTCAALRGTLVPSWGA